MSQVSCREFFAQDTVGLVASQVSCLGFSVHFSIRAGTAKRQEFARGHNPQDANLEDRADLLGTHVAPPWDTQETQGNRPWSFARAFTRTFQRSCQPGSQSLYAGETVDGIKFANYLGSVEI